MTRELREGYTTGTCAAAAAKAAGLLLLGKQTSTTMDTPLPSGKRLVVPIESVTMEGEATARGAVIKDGGDDPDVTHGHSIEAVVSLDPTGKSGQISLTGGQGVGVVTLPGLPVPVGEAAINPDPRRQIVAAMHEILDDCDYDGALRVVIEVPDGQAISQKTMNPRLGITGGISILGTRGTVKPFSNESWAATIRQAMDVARAQGLIRLALATGGRTERLLRRDLPDLPEHGAVQFADFFGLALSEAAARGFDEIIVGCFFGKLVKMAHGFEYTHAHTASIDFTRVARWCDLAGLPAEIVDKAAGSVTARHVLELARGLDGEAQLLRSTTKSALKAARGFAGPGPRLTYRVYDFDGKTICAMGEDDLK